MSSNGHRAGAGRALGRNRAAVHARGRRGAARLGADRAHARPARRGAALAAPPLRAARPRPRGDDRRPGGADGQSRAEGDLPLRLAGGRGRQPRRPHLPRPEPVSGEQRPGTRPAAEQRAAPRRPDRPRRGPQRDALARADRRRRGGRLRRAPERIRADEGDDRGRRRRRALRGPARLREEVRPPRRQGARADQPVRPHARRRPARRRRLRRPDHPDRPHRRALRHASDERRRRSRRRRSSTGERTPEGFFRVRCGLESAIARALAYAPYADLLWFETSTPGPRRGARVRPGGARALPRQAPRVQLLAVVQLAEAPRRRRDRVVPARRSPSSATGTSSSRSPASTRSTPACSSSPGATPSAGCRRTSTSRSASSHSRRTATPRPGTSARSARAASTGSLDAVSGGTSSTLALKGSTEEAQFTAH